MKTLKIFAVLVFAILMAVAVGNAEPQKISGEITDKVAGTNSNDGAPNIRFIVKWEKSLDGVTYPDTSVCMAFGAQVAEFDKLQIGDTINAIADYRKLSDGRESWTLKKLLE